MGKKCMRTESEAKQRESSGEMKGERVTEIMSIDGKKKEKVEKERERESERSRLRMSEGQRV